MSGPVLKWVAAAAAAISVAASFGSAIARDVRDLVTVNGESCRSAMERADRLVRDKYAECSALMSTGRAGRVYEYYNACDRERFRAESARTELGVHCNQMASQYYAMKFSTSRAAKEGVQEATRQGRMRNGPPAEEFARLYRRFENASTIADITNTIVSIVRLPPEAPALERHRLAFDLIRDYGGLAVPGLIPSFMFQLSATGIEGVTRDAMEQFDRAMVATAELARIDEAVASIHVSPFPRADQSSQVSQLPALVRDLQGIAVAGGAGSLNWFAELQRAVAASKANAANQEAAARQQRIANENQRKAQQDADARNKAAEAAFEERMLEMDREVEEIGRQIRNSQGRFPGITFPNVVVPQVPSTGQRGAVPAPSPGRRTTGCPKDVAPC